MYISSVITTTIIIFYFLYLLLSPNGTSGVNDIISRFGIEEFACC